MHAPFELAEIAVFVAGADALLVNLGAFDIERRSAIEVAVALVCAALAVETDAWMATLAALAAFGVAGEIAAQRVQGPGSFAATMIDALHSIDRGTLRARVKAS